MHPGVRILREAHLRTASTQHLSTSTISTRAPQHPADPCHVSDDGMYDVIIVGAGPAGLSAALMLGRCRRRVLVCDTGQSAQCRVPRDARLSLARRHPAGGVPRRSRASRCSSTRPSRFRDVEVTHAECKRRPVPRHASRDGVRLAGRKLLIATGVVDNLPEIPGFRELYGVSVFHCPYCDGWEVRDQPLAVYGRGARGLGLSLELTAWSRDLVLCTDGPSELERRGSREADTQRHRPPRRARRAARRHRARSSASSSTRASRSRAAPSSSRPARRSNRSSRERSGARSTRRAPFGPASTRRRT